MPLHIVIDARRIRDFGIGTYIRSLVHALGEIDKTNRYTLVNDPADVRTLAGLPENFHHATYARTDQRLRAFGTGPWANGQSVGS